MSVRRSAFAQKVLADQELEEQVNDYIRTRGLPADKNSKQQVNHYIRTQGLTSVYKLMLERSLWMPQFRRAMVSVLNTPATPIQPQRALGRHWLADFTISAAVKLKLLQGGNPAAKIKKLIVDAATVAQAHILNKMSFQQSPEGNVIAVVVIQESHFSMHFIPNEDFIAVDVFTCGEIKFDEAIAYIGRQLQSEPHAKIEVLRGIYADNKFVPGIGVQSGDTVHMLTSGNRSANSLALGRHVLLEFYLCDALTINDASWVQKVFRSAIIISGGELHGDFVHQFQPQGVSEASIGSFSRQAFLGGYCDLTVHDYPEVHVAEGGAYAAVGFCDFTGRLNLEKLVNFVKSALKSEKITTHEFLRGAYRVGVDNRKEFFNGFEVAEVEMRAGEGLRR